MLHGNITSDVTKKKEGGASTMKSPLKLSGWAREFANLL